MTLIVIVSKFILRICKGSHLHFAASGTARASRWKPIFIFSIGNLSTKQHLLKALNPLVHRLMVSICYRSTSGTVCLPTTLTTTARESSWTGSSTLPAVSAGTFLSLYLFIIFLFFFYLLFSSFSQVCQEPFFDARLI